MLDRMHLRKIISYNLFSLPLSKLTFFCIIFVVFFSPLPDHSRDEVFGESQYTIYFYNPESNVDNFASLKTRLDLYLKTLGPYQFQPFCDRNTFETNIQGKQDCVLILSSWYYKELMAFFPIKPIFVGVVDNESTQKKVLISKKDINNLKMLKGVSIASAGSKEYTNKFLKLMLGKEHAWLVDTFQILSVPKDIDALISVGFGLVQAALTTEYSISKLSSINQGLYQKLTILAKSDDSLLPIVAVPKTHNSKVSKLLEVVENMGKTVEGKKDIQILGIDSWKRLDENDWKLLRK